MTSITLPPPSSTENLSESLDFIIEYDQWDDWIPDVVYLADVARDKKGALQELEALRKGGKLSLDSVRSLEIFSNDDLKFTTAAIPFYERVIISALIASGAAPVQEKLLADRLNGFEYRPASQRAVYEWTADLFGRAYDEDSAAAEAAATRPLAEVTQTSKTPLFSALNDGLYQALSATSEWLLNTHVEPRSVAWRDIRGFYRSIPRARLWAILGELGFRADVAKCLEEVAGACVAAPTHGIPPIDDAWGFLASAYLAPVDQALSRQGRQFQRAADEYFLMASDTTDRLAGERLLGSELAKLNLTLNVNKRAEIELDMKTLGCDEAIPLAVDAFLLTIFTRTTAPCRPERETITVTTWRRMLRDVLSVPTGSASHNRTMTMLRAMHFARQELVLNAPGLTTDRLSDRARRYRESLAGLGELTSLLSRRLEEAVSARRWWFCHWLLVLLSDFGPQRGAASDAVARLASSPSVDAMVRAQALLTLAKTAEPGVAKPLLERIQPSGSVMADRSHLVALHVAQRRWGGNWLSRFDKPEHTRLLNHLAKEGRQ